MAATRTTQTLVGVLKQQRLAWSCAILVGLFLVLIGHIPVLPVLAGCILAVGFSVLRAKSRLPSRVRGKR
jgi:hypothetical protein